MTQIEREAWERDRARGLGRFVLRVGLLQFGVRFGVIFGLYLFIYYSFFKASTWSLGSIIFGWAVAVAFSGTTMGIYFWNKREKDYQKLKNNNP